MDRENGARPPRRVMVRASLVAALLIAVLLPRLAATAEAEAAGARATDRCDDPSRFTGVSPLVSDPTGEIQALWATSDVPGDLTASRWLWVRVDVAAGSTVHRLLMDVDGDRTTGMWTAQSHLSDNGWDRMVDPDNEVLYRHSAPYPDEWKWSSVKSGGLEVTETGHSVFFCIPVRDLPATDRVYLTAENSENSMPRLFLRGAPYPQIAQPVAPERVRKPKRMAFYYSGSPWIVRHCDSYDDADVACAARVFSRFKHVVFGARLEEPSRGGHDGATALMQKLRATSPKTELWGYISFIGGQKDADGTRDEVYSVAEYIERGRAWKAMGATGVFLDEYDVCDPSWQGWCRPGPDGKGVLLTRERQIAIVQGLHEMGLAVFANSHSVQNALGELDGVASPLGAGTRRRPADMYLLENPTVVNGRYQSGFDLEASQARFAQAVRLTQEAGARLGVLDSMRDDVPDSAFRWEEYRVGWWQAAMANADAYAFFGDTLAILRPPVDALKGKGLKFDSEGMRFGSDGRRVYRTVETVCGGTDAGAIVRERIKGDGSSFVGFVPGPALGVAGC